MATLFKYFKKQSLPTSNKAELRDAAMTILELLENKQYQYQILGSSHYLDSALLFPITVSLLHSTLIIYGLLLAG